MTGITLGVFLNWFEYHCPDLGYLLQTHACDWHLNLWCPFPCLSPSPGFVSSCLTPSPFRLSVFDGGTAKKALALPLHEVEIHTVDVYWKRVSLLHETGLVLSCYPPTPLSLSLSLTLALPTFISICHFHFLIVSLPLTEISVTGNQTDTAG